MIIASTIEQARGCLAEMRRQQVRIGLVPTMGALHEGHLSLIRRCRAECGYTVVSIFVNPTQFAPGEDMSRYPRPFDRDCSLCEKEGVDLIFAPPESEMYPSKNLTWIDVEKVTENLCGASRPGHFRGVCTVVAKLFNIIGPDAAYFGQKDAQQLAVIRRMAWDLNFSIEIRPCPTVREPDGLAMSSRNQYLNPEQRRQALCLYQALQQAEKFVESGRTDSNLIIEAMTKIVRNQPESRIDYISIVDNELLQPLSKIDRPAIVALAVKIGPARLIDNIMINPSGRSF
jgi:pantoate--beta-alanine ligase